MFAPNVVSHIQNAIWNLIHFQYKGKITIEEGKGLTVQGNAQEAVITAENKTALARGFFRLAQELTAGTETVSLHEEPQFESCGAFLDLSCNGVMTVDGCKRYMDHAAALGMNLFALYTEDTYTVPEYKYMGYLRGRYTQAELREMDAYAQSLGLELLPCIQTLGHLGQFLQWDANKDLQDNGNVLMCDEESTYAFIEAEIRSLRSCVSTKRLHIGMDEAHGVGLGRYLAKHGPVDRFELLSRHLKRVTELCKKYDFEPMMWSDMFFRLGSKTNSYYDLQADIPQSVIEKLPEVGMVYWDYYHNEEKWYEQMFTQHEKMSSDTIFAGGIWTWSGFLPNVDLTWATMIPGLKTAARHKVKTVMATMWSDNGNETNHHLAISQLPLFSEFCWRGETCSPDEIKAAGEFLTGLPRDAYEAFSLFYPGPEDRRVGKALIYCDLLYPLGPQGSELTSSIPRSRKALEMLAPYQDHLFCRYATALFDVCLQKALLLTEIRPRYLAGDKTWLAQTAEESLSALIDSYETLRDLHKAMWERDYKRYGWETMALRYGAVIGRLQDVQDVLLRYAEGELDTICELDEEPLESSRKGGRQYFDIYTSPSIGSF